MLTDSRKMLAVIMTVVQRRYTTELLLKSMQLPFT